MLRSATTRQSLILAPRPKVLRPMTPIGAPKRVGDADLAKSVICEKQIRSKPKCQIDFIADLESDHDREPNKFWFRTKSSESVRGEYESRKDRKTFDSTIASALTSGTS
jgi:hypothetical protein